MNDVDKAATVSEMPKPTRAEDRIERWAREIAQYELSGGQEGACPDWVATIQAARFLGGIGPWELVRENDLSSRETWRERTLALMQAQHLVNVTLQHQAQAVQRQAQAAAGLLVPQGTLRA